MIYLNKNESVIEKDNNGINIYKMSLKEKAKLLERELNIINKYGSMDNFNKSQISGEQYFKNLGWK